MRNYGKYTFDTVDEATQLISALEENNHLIVKLGYIELESAIYDEDGEEVTPAVYSDKYSVDVLWKDLELDENDEPIYPDGWQENQLIGLDSYKHNFFGLEYVL